MKFHDLIKQDGIPRMIKRPNWNHSMPGCYIVCDGNSTYTWENGDPIEPEDIESMAKDRDDWEEYMPDLDEEAMSLNGNLKNAIEDLMTANGWTGSDKSVEITQPHIYARFLKVLQLWYPEE